MVSRRRLLKCAAMGVGVMSVSACGGGSAAAEDQPPPGPTPTAPSPTPTPPSPTPTPPSPTPPAPTPPSPTPPAPTPTPPAPTPTPPSPPAPTPTPPSPPAPTPTPPAPTPTPTPPPPPPPSPTPSPAPGTVTSVILQPRTTGTLPYSAAIFPLRGQVPSGARLVSATDTSLASTVLSEHDDGSAAVVVVAGATAVVAGQAATIGLQVSTSAAPQALTTAAISAVVSSVSVAFGSPYGTAQITNFASPERVWWANSQVICARYRVAPPTPGSTALEAVIDIHAYAGGRALVEVVVENAKLNAAASSPTLPAAASYTAAVVSVNGSTVATVNGNGSPEGQHSPTRAWYVSRWVGGDPALRATQLHTDLQQHPLLFKCDKPSSADLSIYANDAYTPWSTGRQRATYMGGGGDHPSIGPLPQWEARALQSGDARTWQATEASALACLGFNVNYRDTTTGLVPTFTQAAGKAMGVGTWPEFSPPNTNMGWENAHHPAVGLMAFLSRPSPVYIELCQKVAFWCGVDDNNPDGGPQQPTGVYGPGYQIRAQAWGLRALSHALFLTPKALAWKADAVTALKNNLTFFDGFRRSPKALLNTIWANRPGGYVTSYPSAGRMCLAGWQYHYFTAVVHKIASARLLTGADQTAMSTFADWCVQQPVRWINEQTNGGWRYIPYVNVIGRAGDPAPTPYTSDFNSYSDWGAQRASWMLDSPSGVSGPWRSAQSDETINRYESGSNFVVDNGGGASYPAYFWHALVCAVERGVPGASQAWATVQANVTNLSTFRAGFGAEPRWGSWPRNV